MIKKSFPSRVRRAPLWRIGPIAFGVFALCLLVLVCFQFSDLERIGRLLTNARPEFLFAALLAQALTYLCSAGVWRQFLRRAGYRQSLRTLVPLGVAKLFADQTIPPNGVSGAILVLRSLMHRGVPSQIAATAILLALFAFYAAFLIVVGVSLTLLWQHHRSHTAWTVALIFFALIAIGIPLLIVFARTYGATA
ncbi:MAG: lysylphosphatidylglycerol synthase domain-containing protein [Alphaproteobacteria bacterium]